MARNATPDLWAFTSPFSSRIELMGDRSSVFGSLFLDETLSLVFRLVAKQSWCTRGPLLQLRALVVITRGLAVLAGVTSSLGSCTVIGTPFDPLIRSRARESC